MTTGPSTIPTLEEIAEEYRDTRADDLVRMHMEYAEQSVSRELATWALKDQGGLVTEVRLESLMTIAHTLCRAIGIELLRRLNEGNGREPR